MQKQIVHLTDVFKKMIIIKRGYNASSVRPKEGYLLHVIIEIYLLAFTIMLTYPHQAGVTHVSKEFHFHPHFFLTNR